jgi:TolA-binding protein
MEEADMSASRKRAIVSLIITLSALGLTSRPTWAQNNVSQEELLRQIKSLEERLRALEAQVHQQQGQPQQGQPQQVQQQRAQKQPPSQRSSTAAPSTAAAADRPAGSPEQAPKATTVAAAGPPQAESPEPKPKNKDFFGFAPSPIEGLKLGMYGESFFGSQQNPAAGGDWQTGFDQARLVLLLGYKFTDSIIFNAEIEFEHAGSGFDNDDKLHGTAEIEQAYIDFLVSKHFNVRSPGIDLVPVGYINQHHEPTQFYSVNRPELDNGRGTGIIPTTWAVPALSVYGEILDGLTYQFQVSSSLEDFGDSFDNRTDANIVTANPYFAGINGLTALNSARPPRGDFRQLNNEMAYALKLAYEPFFLPGFAGSTSFYFSPNIVPRGAHAEDGSPLGLPNTLLGTTSLALFDTEFRYRPPRTGWEFRGEAALVSFGNPAALRANNDGDPTNNVGSTMWGISGEVAYHWPVGRALGSDWEAVPFFRYTYMNLQTDGFSGTDANLPTGAGQQQYFTLGIAMFPTPQVVLKLNYQKVTNGSIYGALRDSFLGAVGFQF